MQSESFSEFMVKYRKDGFRHTSGEIHKKILYSLANGTINSLTETDWDLYLNGGAGKLSEDPVRRLQNLVISVCAVCGHLAILCNVDAELSLSLADYYICITQGMTTEKEILPFFRNVLLHFSDIIARYKTVPYTHTTKRVVEYIYDNIYSPIFVNDIAKALGMNPCYLSKLFKDETNINLKDFVHTEKMKEAKNLMSYTNMSLTEIAAHMGYSDLSHFTRACKTYTGLTPRQLKMNGSEPSFLKSNKISNLLDRQ